MVAGVAEDREEAVAVPAPVLLPESVLRWLPLASPLSSSPSDAGAGGLSSGVESLSTGPGRKVCWSRMCCWKSSILSKVLSQKLHLSIV